MDNLDMLESDYEDIEELEGHIFELYEKTSNREFKSHVQFIKAENLCEAEDLASEVDPDYWKKRSVRSVTVDYAWGVLTELHYSYNIAKSVLGLSDFDE